MRTMATPYNLDVYHDCSKCPVRNERAFCNLSDDAVAELSSIANAIVQPKGALLFVEGEDARGVYILCSGRVKQTMLSAAGRTLIVNVVEPGQVLGVSAAMLGKPYEVTAVTRTLSDFRRQKLLEVKGSTFIVADGLQRLATI